MKDGNFHAKILRYNIDNGLYFGKKNFYIENQNILFGVFLISKNENIKWQLTKIK